MCGRSSNSSSGSDGSSTETRGEKRPWEGTSPEEGEPPSKLMCTSPPHALCAEDVPEQPHQPLGERLSEKEFEFNKTTGRQQGTSGSRLMTDDDRLMTDDDLLPVEATCGVSDDSDSDADNEDERDFLDEEDKDSGFIDSHSIDNSSDDDMDVRLPPTVAISSTNDNNSASDSSSNLSEVQISCTIQSHSVVSAPSIVSSCSAVAASSCEVVSSGEVTSSVSGPTTLLPSCSSAFYAYTSLSSNFLPSVSSIAEPEPSFVPTTYIQSSLSSELSYATSSDSTSSSSLGVESFNAQPSSQSSILSCNNTCSTSVSIADVLATSIGLSIDVPSSLPISSSLSCHNLVVETSTDTQVQNMSAATSSCAQTLPSMLPRGDYLTDSSNMSTTASANSDTTVTSAYSGTVSSPVYDPLLYHPYTHDNSPRQLSSPLPNGSWSCNYYDGNQPTITNKYMEIQTSKVSAVCSTPPPPSSQAIQCDANGKSYMDLGSSSPFTQPYSPECGNYTTSPSNHFSNPLYNNQGCTSSNNYNKQPQTPPQSPNNHFYRTGYSQFNNFSSDAAYDADQSSNCSYNYPPNYPGGRQLKMMPPRCGSPFCDSSKPTSMRSPCYQQQRLAVLNMSTWKLNRFSRCPDPPLHKNVLVYNTIKLIEKEFESEGISMAAVLSQQHMMQTGMPPHCPPPPPPTPPPIAMGGTGSSEGPLPSMHPPIISSPISGPCTPPPVLPPPIMPPYNGSPNPYRGPHYVDGTYEDMRAYSPVLECDPLPASDNQAGLHSLRPSNLTTAPIMEQSTVQGTGILPCNSNNNTSTTGNISNSNFNGGADAGSPSPSEDRTEGAINWCSVLTLPSQSDLDSLNTTDFCEWNNESSMEIEYSSNGSNISGSNSRSNSSNSSNNVSPSSSYKLDLPSLSADDVLKSFHEQPRRIEPTEELDNLIDVLVES